MDEKEIQRKFGDAYEADERAFVMGIDRRFTRHFAARLRGRHVLETCTGGGFSTLEIAREARHVTTVEIDPARQDLARRNVARAGLIEKVTFVSGDALDPHILDACGACDAAFLDPDWAVSGPDHVYRFRDSNTRPPADVLLAAILDRLPDVGLILPPLVDVGEFAGLPPHECQALYLDGAHELYALWFGALAGPGPVTELRV